MRNFLSIAGLSLLALASSHAATIYQTANDTTSDAWSTDGAPWGGTAPIAGNDYFTVAGLPGTTETSSGFGANFTTRLRDTGSVFPGNSLTIAADTEVLLKGGDGSVSTGNIILDGGIIAYGVAGANTVSLAGNLNVPSTGIIGMGGANTININSTLTGSGTLSLRSSDTTPTIIFSGNLSGFNGTFQIGGGDGGYVIVDFDQDYTLSASITMGTVGSTLDVLNLSHALTVNSFQFGATSLSPGTYTVAQLNSLVGNGSQFTGTGTLTPVAGNLAPSIGINPTWNPASVMVGQTASITVTPSGSAPLSYQWLAGMANSGSYIALTNSGNLSGVTTTTLTVNNAQFANALDYVVVVSNAYGSVTSAVPAHLTVLAAATPAVFFNTNGLALKPPMGWNAWNYFQFNIDETIVRAIADAMATNGMEAAGYEYINLDDMWQKSRDANGVIQADPIRFPSGIKALADYVHSKGLKLGLYSDHGLQTCQDRPGSYGYEYIDANTYASWGVDYLKYDNCGLPSGDVPQNDYALMADALLKTGRPIVYSICSWSFDSWQPRLGNLWRTTGDIGSTFASITSKLSANSAPAFFAGPGHWNDPDMLEVGNGNMTFTENQSHFSLWCLMAAPLLAGNDLTTMSAQTLSILTNAELIAVDQDPAGEQGVPLPNTGTNQIWVKPLGYDFTTKAVGLFNPNSSATTITVNWTDIGLRAGNATVRDLWAGENLGTFNNSFTTNVPAHATVVLKVVGTAPLLPGLGTNYLSDLQPAYAYVGWGTMTKDKSIGGNAIKLNGVTYSKGLGVHAFSGVEYRLGGIASRFQSDIGVDDEVGTSGSVVFHVIADGTEIYTSDIMNGGAAHQTINLNVTGVNRLILGVSDADNGNGSDHADWAGALVVVSNTAPAAPPVPAGLSAQSGSPIKLAWYATPGALSYNIYRANALTGPYINQGSSVLPAYADSNVVSATTYYYQVTSVNGFGESSNSLAASAYACIPPAAPSGVVAVAQSQQISLSWNPVPGATSYSVARALPATPFSIIATGVTGTNYTDRNVSLGTNYSYVVYAYNGCSQSGRSACVFATPTLTAGNITLQHSTTNLMLAWPQGMLHQATNLAGPWEARPGASPNTIVATNTQMFFRLQIQANPISINFSGSGTAMASSELAGVVPETNWNNAPGLIVVNAMPLKDATGSPSGATAAWLTKTLSNTGVSDTAGNNRMMRNYLDTRNNFDTATVVVNGLISNPNGWNVYVYFDGNNGAETREGSYTISGPGITTTTVLSIDAASADFSGTFIQANNSAGNYVEFSIPNVPGFTVDATPYTNGAASLRAPINGIQIIPK